MTVYFKKQTLTMPESFEELSGKQFIQIADLLSSGGESLHCHIRAFMILTGIGRLKLRLMSTEFVERCLPLVKWVFDPEARKEMTIQLITKFKGMWGPASGFDNLKMNEFHFSEIHYHQLVYQEDASAIDSLVSVLYRPAKPGYDKIKNPDGDIREPFNANEVEYYAGIIKRWPDPIKQAIFIWYDICRQQLVDNNQLVFKEPSKGFESQFDTGLYGIMRSLAGEKLGSIAAIEDMYVHTAMLELGLLREEELYIEEQMKKTT